MFKQIKLHLVILVYVSLLMSAQAQVQTTSGQNESSHVENDAYHLALAHNERGFELAKSGRWEEAIKEHEAALMAEPLYGVFRFDLSRARHQYGDILFQNHNYEKAETQYRVLLYIDPQDSNAAMRLQECLKQQHKQRAVIYPPPQPIPK